MKVVENKLKISSQAQKHILALRNMCRGLINDWKLAITHADTQKKKIKTHKNVKNVFCWPFLCAFNSCHVCIYNITHFQLLLGLWMHSWVPASVFEPDPSFLTNFWLLLSILSCFYLFPTIFNYSINFTHFQSSLFVFDCFYPDLSVPTYFYLSFSLFSTIFDHFQPPLFIFNHFQQFTITWLILFGFKVIFIFTNLNSFSIVIVYIQPLTHTFGFYNAILLIYNSVDDNYIY